jgi:hypothetical protein
MTLFSVDCGLHSKDINVNEQRCWTPVYLYGGRCSWPSTIEDGTAAWQIDVVMHLETFDGLTLV